MSKLVTTKIMISIHTNTLSSFSLFSIFSELSVSPISTVRTKSRKYLYLSTCTGSLLGVLVGLSFGWSSPYIVKLREEEHFSENPIGRLITTEEASWIGSFLPFGAIFGTFITRVLVQKIGRKKTMIFNCAIPFLVAFLILAFSKSLYIFYLARLISGVTISGFYTVVPMYLSEISEDEIRGFICSLVMAFETFGELIILYIGPYVTIFTASFICVGIASFTAIDILVILPESPYYLLSIQKKDKAEKALMTLRSCTKDEVAIELEFIRGVIQENLDYKSRFIDLWKTKACRRAEAIFIGLTVFQQMSGIVPVLLYSESIFLETGSNIPAHFCTMAVGTVQFLGTFVTPHLVDRLGRRLMLFISACGMCLFQTILGLYFFLKEREHNVEQLFWVPVVCLVFYVISYSIGFGPLIWTIMAEIFPTHLKATAVSVGVCSYWLMAFTVGRIFYPISTAIGMGECFWVFGGFCFFAIIFICTFVIETKGKNEQQIQALLNK